MLSGKTLNTEGTKEKGKSSLSFSCIHAFIYTHTHTYFVVVLVFKRSGTENAQECCMFRKMFRNVVW